MEFRWNKENVLKILKLNNEPSEKNVSPELVKARRNIYLQAGLAFLTIVLTIVIIFSMTSAWYTNIVQTSGLIFEVESWGYSGSVVVDETPVAAGPGDNGVVGLKVSGESEEILEVKINVSKELMNDNMKERMFFYVDTTENINGETVDRVYVNNYEDYTYTVFRQGSILMSEDFSNVPELKWQWVYDVLGYYVLADADSETGTFTVKDYLRPIEYDFDDATFKKVAVEVDGETANVTAIATVDGTRTPEEFLEDFSLNDGYSDKIIIYPEGEETATETFTAGGRTYYKVAEDKNSYGIYAYLCNIAEIEESTGEDTDMGTLALKKANGETLSEGESSLLSFTARISVSVEQKQFETAEVSDAAELLDKIENPKDGEIIKLTSGIELGNNVLEIPADKDIWIDLGGNTITSTASGSNYAIAAGAGSSVTLMNGTVKNENAEKTGRAINSVGAEINLSNIKVEGFDFGMYIGDNANGNTVDSAVRVSGCEFTTGTCAFFVSGNGVLSEQKTQLIIDSSTVVSDGYVICGNGTVADNGGRWGTDIQIIKSTVESTGAKSASGYYAVIYHPQKDSSLTVYESTVTGLQGIAVKGGSIDIVNSQIIGKATVADLGSGSGSGSGNTGDAIYIETEYNYAIELRVRQNSILTAMGADQQAIRIDDPDAVNVSVEIISGIFTPSIIDSVDDYRNGWLAKDSAFATSDGKTVVTSNVSETAEAETGNE